VDELEVAGPAQWDRLLSSRARPSGTRRPAPGPPTGRGRAGAEVREALGSAFGQWAATVARPAAATFRATGR
jgi:hypothetical protein